MTWDEFIRYILLPALGSAALFALVVTLRQTYREWKEGLWD